MVNKKEEEDEMRKDTCEKSKQAKEKSKKTEGMRETREIIGE